MSDGEKLQVDGESLKARRKQIRMSVQELSLETGLSASVIRELEKGGAVEADTLSRLASALRVKPEELMVEE